MVMTTPELVDLTLHMVKVPQKKLGLKYGTWKIWQIFGGFQLLTQIRCTSMELENPSLQYSYLAYRKSDKVHENTVG